MQSIVVLNFAFAQDRPGTKMGRTHGRVLPRTRTDLEVRREVPRQFVLDGDDAAHDVIAFVVLLLLCPLQEDVLLALQGLDVRDDIGRVRQRTPLCHDNLSFASANQHNELRQPRQ